MREKQSWIREREGVGKVQTTAKLVRIRRRVLRVDEEVVETKLLLDRETFSS